MTWLVRVAAGVLLVGCTSSAPPRMRAPEDASVDGASDSAIRDSQVDSGAAGNAGGDGANVVVDGSAGTGGASNEGGSLPQRTSQPISLDSDVLGETPREVVARVAGTYDFELGAPLGRVSITVPATATTATLMTVVLNRFIEVPLDAQLTIGDGEALRGGSLIINGTSLVVFERHFDADILPRAFFSAHVEASACTDARIVLGWDGATVSTASLQLLKPQADPDRPVDVCYVEIGTL